MSKREIELRNTSSLERLVDCPQNYGIYYGRHSLRNILDFALDHPESIDGATESAFRKIKRCIAPARHKSSHPARLQGRIARQLQIVHGGLAWAELDRRLRVKSRFWNTKRYTLLVRELLALATMHEYWWQRWPDASGPAGTPAGEKIRALSRLMVKGWRSLRDYLEIRGVSWKMDIASTLSESGRPVEELRGRSQKALYSDRSGVTWLIKYDHESILNPVLASIFSRLTDCPGGHLCPVFLDYDTGCGQPCSVQRYLEAERVRRFERCSTEDYRALLGGSRLRASQALCQAIQEWLLGNSDGNQVIMDSRGDLIFIDQDRSFFADDLPGGTKRGSGVQTPEGVLRHDGAPKIRTPLLEATLPIPGVSEDLACYIARVEAMPDEIYEGLARNASYRASQLCSLFYIDVSHRGAMTSVCAVERWIETLLARKRNVREILASRLRDVFGTSLHRSQILKDL